MNQYNVVDSLRVLITIFWILRVSLQAWLIGFQAYSKFEGKKKKAIIKYTGISIKIKENRENLLLKIHMHIWVI